jgi:hypothetical protein
MDMALVRYYETTERDLAIDPKHVPVYTFEHSWKLSTVMLAFFTFFCGIDRELQKTTVFGMVSNRGGKVQESQEPRKVLKTYRQLAISCLLAHRIAIHTTFITLSVNIEPAC